LVSSTGLIAGLTAWQSQDFGIAAVVALGFVILVSNGLNNAFTYKLTIFYSTGILIGLMVYPIIGKLFGHK
jgi:hypothetical protein